MSTSKSSTTLNSSSLTLTNGWDVAGAVSSTLLSDLVTSLWNNGISGTKIPTTITISGITYTLGSPTVTLTPDGTPFSNGLTLELKLTSEKTSTTATIQLNLDNIALMTVMQNTFMVATGSAGSYANCQALGTAIPDSGCSFMGWVKSSSTSDQSVLSLVDGSDSSKNYLEVVLSDNNVKLVYGDTTYSVEDQKITPDLSDKNWHHVAVTISKSSSTASVSFFVDGQPLGTSVTMSSFSGFSSDKVLLVGGNTSRSSTAEITGVSVWTTALTTTEIRRLMNADISKEGVPSDLGAIGYWSFEANNNGQAYNLLDTSSKVQMTGSASLKTSSESSFATYLTFGTYSLDKVMQFSTSPDISAIDNWVTNKISPLFAKGAVVLAKFSNDDASPKAIPSLIEFAAVAIDENDTSKDELHLLAEIGNDVPPTSGYETGLQLVSGGNLGVGIYDYFVFNAAKTKLEDTNGFSNVKVSVGPPAVLTATYKKAYKGVFNVDAKISVKVVNNKGLKITTSLQGNGILDGDVSFVMSVTCTPTSTGTKITLDVEDSSSDLAWNQSNGFVIGVEAFLAVLAAFAAAIAVAFPGIGTAIGYLIASFDAILVTWLATLPTSINNKIKAALDKLGGKSTIVDQDITAIDFEDGFYIEAQVNAPGAEITSISTDSQYENEKITLTGRGFVDDTTKKSRLSKAVIGGQETSALGTPSGTYDSATVEVTVPSGGTGVATTVQLITSSGSVSNKFGSFSVLGTAAPSNVALQSDSTTGIPGSSTVVLTGSGFTGTNSVYFGTEEANQNTIVVKSDTELHVDVPKYVTDAVKVKVTNNKGSTESSNEFTPLSAPAVSSISPPNGQDTYAFKGDVLTVKGTNFGSSSESGAITVYFTAGKSSGQTSPQSSGVTATIQSNTELTVTVPGDATTGSIWLSNKVGTSNASQQQIEIRNRNAPTITGVNPDHGGVSQEVTISGSNFSGAMSVSIAGANCAFTLTSNTQLKATIGSSGGSIYSSEVVVSTLNASGSLQPTSASDFTFVEQPQNVTCSPNTGSVGTTVKITCNNLKDGFMYGGKSIVQSVAFGTGHSTTDFSVNSNTSLTVKVPDGNYVSSRVFPSVTTTAGTGSASKAFKVST